MAESLDDVIARVNKMRSGDESFRYGDSGAAQLDAERLADALDAVIRRCHDSDWLIADEVLRVIAESQRRPEPVPREPVIARRSEREREAYMQGQRAVLKMVAQHDLEYAQRIVGAAQAGIRIALVQDELLTADEIEAVLRRLPFLFTDPKVTSAKRKLKHMEDQLRGTQ